MSIVLLFVGLYQSYSRAALLAAIILTLIYAAQSTKPQIPKNKQILNSKSKITVCCLLAIGLLSTVYCLLSTDVLLRAGTSQHLTRPVQAIKDGLESPLIGNLGSYGPVARAKSLRENNDDKAPIAENVLADTFVQTGLLSLILILGFWISLYRVSSFEARVWIFTIFLTTSLATLFDMIPLAIIYFWVLISTTNHAAPEKKDYTTQHYTP